jgi:3-deoxy-manno-octulosonate cytidylyltransferase (CMP-KDO synthetase)
MLNTLLRFIVGVIVIESVVIIPARLNSSRFQRKMLAEIDGKPLIVHTLENAKKAKIGGCYVACCSEEIKGAVEMNGGTAILTAPDLPSGTDRVFAAIQKLNLTSAPEIIVNLQGDTTHFDPNILRRLIATMQQNKKFDIATPAIRICEKEDANNPNVVKVAFNNMENLQSGRAIYFSRAAIPGGSPILFRHVGIYAYRSRALKKFASTKVSYLEESEKLEQLRGLQMNMHIEVIPIDSFAYSVDVATDLGKIKEHEHGQRSRLNNKETI